MLKFLRDDIQILEDLSCFQEFIKNDLWCDFELLIAIGFSNSIWFYQGATVLFRSSHFCELDLEFLHLFNFDLDFGTLRFEVLQSI